MQRTLMALSIAAATFAATTASADVSEDQLRALEARIAQLEAAPAGEVRAADKFKFNGFMSAGFGYANAGDLQFDNGLYEEASHKADSVVGFQVEGKVNDKTNTVLQLAARGAENFRTQAEWAYVGYRPGDADEIRLGRLRTSFYLMSEYLEVGYAYPWVRPPAEVYQASFPSSYDGLSWLHKINAGDWQHDIHVNWGTTGTQSDELNDLVAENAWGMGLTSSVGNWQFGARVSGADITAGNPLFDALAKLGLMSPIVEEPITYSSVGFQYDNGSLLLMAEGTQVEVDGVIPDTQSSYITLGYRIGKVMPHLTWASTKFTDQGDRPNLLALSTQNDLPPPLGTSDVLAPDLCPLSNPNPDASLCLARVPLSPLDPRAALLPPGTQTVGVAFPADTIARMLESEQDSITLGLRYDFLPNAALKFDWTRVLDTHGTFGLLSAADGNLFVDLATGAPLAKPSSEFDVLRVVVDVVF